MKAALIGTGRIAQQHLACVGRLDSVDLAAVCDPSPAAAELAAERFCVPRWFTDHRAMLDAVKADVVHVTAPPHVHFDLGLDALAAGGHVIVEKPAARNHDEVHELMDRARAGGRHVVECQNYLFNPPIVEVQSLWRDGVLGDIVHVEITMCLDILAPGSPFADRSVPHPALSLPGGAIADFLPHLASLAHAFVGPHDDAHAIWLKRDASSPLPSDEFRGLVAGRGGATAALSFSSHGQPDAFTVRVTGTRGRATAGLFEPRVTVERLRAVPRLLVPTFNGIDEARTAIRAAVAGFTRKLAGGPGGYEGLWTLIERTYAALADGTPLPVPAEQVQAVHRLIDDLVSTAPAPA
jgi:predicted dehydrogenase